MVFQKMIPNLSMVIEENKEHLDYMKRDEKRSGINYRKTFLKWECFTHSGSFKPNESRIILQAFLKLFEGSDLY